MNDLMQAQLRIKMHSIKRIMKDNYHYLKSQIMFALKTHQEVIVTIEIALNAITITYKLL